jgi:3-oxoacyl-[acyl-carrier protein] reductase
MTHTPTALITGAGSAKGIGFATATLLARNGYQVLLCGHSIRVEERAAQLRHDGHNAQAFAGDITDPATRESLAAWVKNTTYHLDAMVINHGMTSVSAPMEDTEESGSIDNTPPEAFEMSLARNLTSSYAIVRLLMPLVRASQHGRIVAVSSVTGGTMAMAHEVSYAASKAGLEGMVRALAVDEAHHGITVNAVAPGWIATESQTDREIVQGGFTPMKRSGTAAEVAAVIGFLTSPEASYITGQVIVVDGGNSIAEERCQKM